MPQEFKTIKELIKENDSFIQTIPNNLGINLCSIEGIEYDRQADGQLKALTILFIPNSGLSVGDVPTTHIKGSAEPDFLTRLRMEQSELFDKLSKLSMSLDDSDFRETVGQFHIRLLQKQLKTMLEYHDTLNQRIYILELERKNKQLREEIERPCKCSSN